MDKKKKTLSAKDASLILLGSCMLQMNLSDTFKAELPKFLIIPQGFALNMLGVISNYCIAQGCELKPPEDTLASIQRANKGGEPISLLEKQSKRALSHVLKEMVGNVTLQTETFLPATANIVDFFVPSAGGDLVIQIDGPSHFLNVGTKHQCVNGLTALKTRHLESLGYGVLRLPYNQLDDNGIGQVSIQELKPTIPKPLQRYLKKQLEPYKELLQQGVA